MIGWFFLSLLSVYTSCVVSILCWRVRVANFDDKTPYKQFPDSLKQCCKDHEEELSTLGFNVNGIGTHSIWKGAASLVASLPGGPSAASICIQAGWMMGKVCDICLQYLEAGDLFIGCCLALLPLLSTKFAVLPPHFSNEVPNEWQADKKKLVFLFVVVLGGFGWLLEICLAQVVYHRDVITDWQANHIA
jgi:hypothetical protein